MSKLRGATRHAAVQDRRRLHQTSFSFLPFVRQQFLADDWWWAVLAFLVPLIVPLPVMFPGSVSPVPIQALIFALLAAYYIVRPSTKEAHLIRSGRRLLFGLRSALC